MHTFSLKIPEELLLTAKIPRQYWEQEIKKELALQLYREGIFSFANARRLAEMSKIEFHYLLGERQIPRQYDITEYKKDLENLAKWRAKQ
jgi:predicted HTH domain antitoxin